MERDSPREFRIQLCKLSYPPHFGVTSLRVLNCRLSFSPLHTSNNIMSSGNTQNPLGQDEFLKFADQSKEDRRARVRELQQENEARHVER